MKQPRTRLFQDTLDHARGLRHYSTDAESMLWYRMRGRRLAGAKFWRQYPLGPSIVDFCCPESKLVIELDGGGHAEHDQVANDAHRKKELERLGMTVLTFWNSDVLQNLEGVLERISETLAPPSP